eukprot:Plantae.Rhodophyta-Hildenbrandia_rubra.ctg404.p1 GENE.Plantae.Rhodophyta-Hildenbrandia_rubra.ctg404~~Plantae.Rhodophyta-Hildenbrandia_rubra.ctg404.p1  ORF type:complete len:561 (-),score=87.99 Plantae.Rhodophyta-Hildenbrandia_rubra.ctg404:1058-2740(-)
MLMAAATSVGVVASRVATSGGLKPPSLEGVPGVTNVSNVAISTGTSVPGVSSVAGVNSISKPIIQSPRIVSVAATQFASFDDVDVNVKVAERIVREAASRGARIILLQELFATHYFPIQHRDFFKHAISIDGDRGYLTRFEALARELQVVLPISFYERCNNAYFNSVAVIDADGTIRGIYRKSHIPMSPGYLEKAYFAPGDTGFRVFKTAYANIGIGVCWDQWFPETARCLALAGAELIFFPTAIGSEPQDPALDTCGQWQRAMQGHAACNLIPVIASNRIGKETSMVSAANQHILSITFYGSSFITDHTGAIQADAGRQTEAILVHSFNLDEIRTSRASWGVFRDRRPSLYGNLCSLDGMPVAPTTPERYISQSAPVPAASMAAIRALKGESSSTTPIGSRALTTLDPLEGMDTTPRAVTTYDTPLATEMLQHDATWIGEVKTTAQRRPRGRCWVCRKKTTFECKNCAPGPVPLCSRTARDCWWKYHSGEVPRFVPNKRGRKRSLSSQDHVLSSPEKMSKGIAASAMTTALENTISPTITSPGMNNDAISPTAIVAPDS